MTEALTGKVIIVTGATAGIGKEIARKLCQQGATVVMPCRNQSRGEVAAEEMKASLGKSPPTGSLVVLPLDLSSIGSIETFVQEFRTRFGGLGLYALVNNAAEVLTHKESTKSGLERTFASSALGPYYLSKLLVDDLARASSHAQHARMVHVSSHYAGDVDVNDFNFERRKYDSHKAYKQNKAINRLVAGYFARSLASRSIDSNSCHPGVIRTGLLENLGFTENGSFDVASGAETPVWMASSKQMEGVTGKFFDRRRANACKFSGDIAMAEEVVRRMDEIIAERKAEAAV